MLVLEAGHIKKTYGDRLIFEFEELKVYRGDKIGIVGQNGSGKTTLMDILAGEVEPDEGFVRIYGDLTYIHQFSDEISYLGRMRIRKPWRRNIKAFLPD